MPKPASSPSAGSSLPLPVVAKEEQGKRLCELSKPWKSALHIVFLLVLLCLVVFGQGEEGNSLFLCFREGFGEGCSSSRLDITLTCLFVLLILIWICRCLRDFAKYRAGEEEGSPDGRLHQEQMQRRKFRPFDSNQPWKKENILSVLFLLVLLSLIFIGQIRGDGVKDPFLFSCFGEGFEGCSGLDITVNCLSVLLILLACSHVLLKCFYREEKVEIQCETV